MELPDTVIKVMRDIEDWLARFHDVSSSENSHSRWIVKRPFSWDFLFLVHFREAI